MASANSLIAAIVLQVITPAGTRTVTLQELQKKVLPTTVTVFSPVYRRPLSYEGFWLDEVLPILKISAEEEDVVFLSSDGYATSLSPDEIGRHKWLLAYAEPNGWTPLPEHSPPASPGPWYLVGSDPASYRELPWPYQITTLKTREGW